MKDWLASVVLLLLLAGCATPAAPVVPEPTPLPTMAAPQTLRVVHSESLEPVMVTLASAYQRQAPAAQVILVERADTLALQALLSGDVDLAVLSWLPPEALPSKAWRAVFALDGLAVIVNPQNGVPGLTLEQLRQLFQGQRDDWASWEGMPGMPQIISREDASGDYAFFQRRVMGDNRVTLTALLAPSTQAVLNVVAEDPLAVGYVSSARVDGHVRILAIEGVPPAPEAIATGIYPLSRELHLVSLEEPQGAIRSFAQWMLDSQGQDIVQRQGFLPVEPTTE